MCLLTRAAPQRRCFVEASRSDLASPPVSLDSRASLHMASSLFFFYVDVLQGNEPNPSLFGINVFLHIPCHLEAAHRMNSDAVANGHAV